MSSYSQASGILIPPEVIDKLAELDLELSEGQFLEKKAVLLRSFFGEVRKGVSGASSVHLSLTVNNIILSYLAYLAYIISDIV